MAVTKLAHTNFTVRRKMDTFGQRVDMALMAQGEDTTKKLARLIKATPTAARTWLKMVDAPGSCMRLKRLSEGTGYRMYWLVTGEGHPSALRNIGTAEEEALMKVVHGLTKPKLKQLLRFGERLRRESAKVKE